jgi:general secretion pathway protein F
LATQGSGLTGGSVTIDQLIALNDEMAALIRAGVPLEQGLLDAGRDLQGQLGSMIGELGERLGRGERLTEALAGSRRRVPEVYLAVIEAGLRSGRLAEALEGMAKIARSHAEMRRNVGLAMIYPLIVLELAYGLTVLFVVQMAPRFIETFEVLGIAPILTLNRLARLGESVQYWGPIPPLLLPILAFAWFFSGRSSALDSGFLSPIFRRFPIIGPMIRDYRSASFADLLAMLIDHQVPLDEAVELAGAASGDKPFLASARLVAGSIRSGQETSVEPGSKRSAFPPLLAWIMSGGRGRGDFAGSLRQTAATYRRRAENRSHFLSSSLPTVLLLAIGAGAVIVYALLLFIPLTSLWDGLAIPVNQ